MALKSYKARSCGMRFRESATFEEITEKRPVKRLTKAVRTANMKGGLKYIRGTRKAVTEKTWKKAIVTVKPGERVELA